MHPEYQIDYIIAPPRMAKYMEYSTKIYNIYLKYVAPEDIHAYSIDEVFVDITQYLILTGFNAYEFACQMIKDVLKTTGIIATAGSEQIFIWLKLQWISRQSTLRQIVMA